MFGKKHKRQVLLLDGSDQVRAVTQSILESGGYSVTAVASVIEALKSLGEKKFDIIISEVEISGKGGFAFYQRVKNNRETADIPFVFVTGYDQDQVLKEMRKNDLFIPKPIKSSDFLKQINQFANPAEVQRSQPQEQPSAPATEKPSLAPPTLTTLKLNFEMAKRTKRKRKVAIVALPPDPPTKHFSDPQGLFHYKQIHASFRNIFRAYKSGKNLKIPPINFPKSEFPWEYTILPVPVPVGRPKKAPVEVEEEVLFGLDMEEAALDDQVLWDTDEGVEEVREETSPLASIQQKVPEYNLPEKSAWYRLEKGSLQSSSTTSLSAEDVEQNSQIVFSMASLCFQMLGEDFAIIYVAVETEDDQIFFVQDQGVCEIAVGKPLD